MTYTEELMERAWKINPTVLQVDMGGGASAEFTLHEIVADEGWDRAMCEYPEVREFLDRLKEE